MMGVRCKPLCACVCACVPVSLAPLFGRIHVCHVGVWPAGCEWFFFGSFTGVEGARLWRPDSISAGYSCGESQCKL